MSEAIIQPTEKPILPPTESPPATMAGTEMFGKELDAAFNAIDGETPKKEEVKEQEADVKEAVSEEQPKESTPKIDLKPKEPEVVEQIPEDAAVPRKSEDWKKFKSAYNATRTLLKDREAKLAELEKQAERVKDLDNVLKEREELQAKLKEYSVLGDPALTKDIDTRIESVTSKAKSGLDGKKAAMLETISRMPSGEAKDNLLAELFEDVPAHKQAVIGAHVATLEELYGERESRLTEARTHADEILQRRESEAKASQEKRRMVLDSAYKDAVTDLRTKEGWKDLFENQEVANLIDSEAKEIYSGNINDAKTLAQKAVFAAVTPMLLGYAIEQAKRVAELESTLEELRAATPKTGGAVPTSGPKAAPESVDDMFSLDKLRELMQQ